MQYLYLMIVWIHVLAAMVWIGGSLFLVLVFMPVVRHIESKSMASSLLRRGALKFRRIGWICLVILILTGILNLGFRGYGWARLFDGSLFAGAFGRILAVKLSLVLSILIISLLHDFLLGPRAAELILKDPDSPEARRARKVSAWMGRLTLLFGLAATGAAIALVRGWPR